MYTFVYESESEPDLKNGIDQTEGGCNVYVVDLYEEDSFLLYPNA